MEKLRIGVLGSGTGTNYRAIQDAIDAGKLNAETRVVISDVEGAGILQIARERGVEALFIPPGKFRTRLEPEVEQRYVDALKNAGVDLLALAGYMRMVKEPMLRAFPRRIINIHPSLLPKFPGLEAWKQALAAGGGVTGCTIHYVDDGMDTGEIIAQRDVPILPGDTPETLHARIQVAEHALYPEVIGRLAVAGLFEAGMEVSSPAKKTGVSDPGYSNSDNRAIGSAQHRHLTRLDRVWIRQPVYFVTVCTSHRRPVLANDIVQSIFVEVWENARRLYGWSIGRYVIMPDHVHFFCAPKDGAKPLNNFVGKWKEWTAKYLHRRAKVMMPVWQAEFFDHLLRSNESYDEKWEYVRQNPVRAALVAGGKDWPYQGCLTDLRVDDVETH